MVYKVGHLQVTIQHGDITEVTANAIVNVASVTYEMSRDPVARRIAMSGGSKLVDEWKAKGNMSGTVLVTGAGLLNCRYVIHVLATSDVTRLRDHLKEALDAGDMHKTSCIAVPSFGPGSPEALRQALISYCGGPSRNIHKVMIVVLDVTEFQQFEKVFRAEDRGVELNLDELSDTVVEGSPSMKPHAQTSWKKLQKRPSLEDAIRNLAHDSLETPPPVGEHARSEGKDTVVEGSPSMKPHAQANRKKMQKTPSLEDAIRNLALDSLETPPPGGEHARSEGKGTTLPALWKKGVPARGPWEAVPVPPGSKEFNEVSAELLKTLKESQIVKIDRIQNPGLYRKYMTNLQVMADVNPRMTVNERLLYHGTAADSIASINAGGLDRSFSGKHGSRYGQGVYFAVRANYSAMESYSPSDRDRLKYIYRCRVLTGLFTKGNGDMRTPPVRDSTTQARYDSVVDQVNEPLIFVIFQDAHAYPEYLIAVRS